VEGLLGKTLADFAKLLETPFLDQWLMAFRSKEARDLGEITYGDEHVRQALICPAFSTPRKLPGVLIENVAIVSAQKKRFA